MSDIGYASDRLPVFVSIAPQKYFVQQIGKDLVDIRVMVDPGASPATYEPRPRQMAGISEAVAYFAMGVPFEGRLIAGEIGCRVAFADPLAEDWAANLLEVAGRFEAAFK